MNRRRVLYCFGVVSTVLLPGVRSRGSEVNTGVDFVVLNKPKSEWKEILEPARYAVLFREDTERPGSSPLNAEKRKGTFICAACYLPLFASEHKYESGTGWPSFTQP